MKPQRRHILPENKYLNKDASNPSERRNVINYNLIAGFAETKMIRMKIKKPLCSNKKGGRP
jgi:hypothetical protein